MLTSIALVLGGTGCASIMSGPSQNVSVQTEPEGAKATLFNKKGEAVSIQQTPFIVALKRSEKYTLKVEKDQFKPLETPIKKGVNGWYFGNVLFGGMIGLLIVDPATGAIYSFNDPIKVILAPSDSDKLSLLFVPVVSHPQSTTKGRY